jgi:rhomboid protease GluP
MAHARVCPSCGKLNGAEESTCFSCGRRLPGPVTTGLVSAWQGALGREAAMSKLYVGLCVIAYALMTLTGGGFTVLGGVRYSVAIRWGAIATNFEPLLPDLGHVEPWRYLSAMFVHFGLLHIGFNMMALWDLGRVIEQRLGSARFVLIFIATGVLGFVVSDVWYEYSGKAAVTGGASGGLFGLVAALVGYLYAARDPAWKQLAVRVIIYAAIFAFAFPVNNAAHAGGFVVGLGLGYLFYKERRPWVLSRVFGWVSGVLVVASLASVALSLSSNAWRIMRLEEIRQGMD